MAYKALIFGTDDLYPKMKPFYDAEVVRGNLEIVAVIDDINNMGGGYDLNNFDLAIISSKCDFYRRMKMLEAQGLSRNQIIDGRVFQIPNLDFPRFLKEGIAYGSFEKSPFKDQSCCIYTRIFSIGKTIVKFGVKSYSAGSSILGAGEISIGKYSPVASGSSFQLARNVDHNYGLIGSYALTWIDWQSPKNYLPPTGICKMEVGNDVWIGRGCIFKSINPKKPLVIGDGAVIASNSVVVKNVPPYAIVGGNPAQIIKYRFEPHIIDALLRIKWWDWTLDKIHDNFKYWNDIDKFVSLHDN